MSHTRMEKGNRVLGELNKHAWSGSFGSKKKKKGLNQTERELLGKLICLQNVEDQNIIFKELV